MQLSLNRKPRVLVAPLDWGLGHTTRCVPIIYELISNDVNVILAGNAVQKALLLKEFPALAFLDLEGYNVSYSDSAPGFALKILNQAPSILKTIRKEKKWLEGIIEKFQIDAVISDNRFGLCSKKIFSIFITHQLLIKSDFGKVAERLLQQFNYSYINKFNRCWVPDFDDDHGLAGDLSHPKNKPAVNLQYIGPLTRIKKIDTTRIRGHVLIMLSGPEPLRSIFEKIVFDQLEQFSGTATVLRGLPADANPPPLVNGVAVFNHLSQKQINEEFCRAEFFVGRTGYSSVMDIAGLDIKPILVPTPGQTEQEYLGKYLGDQRFCITAQQDDFNLIDLLKKAQDFDFQNPFKQKEANLKDVVELFTREIKSRANV